MSIHKWPFETLFKRIDQIFSILIVSCIIVYRVNILVHRVRLWVTPGRGYFTVERIKSEIRISKSETNLKFECSNAQNKKESIRCITVNLFGTLEFWSLEFVSYFGFRASIFLSIYFGKAKYLRPGPKTRFFRTKAK